jgi:hypothetical protein
MLTLFVLQGASPTPSAHVLGVYDVALETSLRLLLLHYHYIANASSTKALGFTKTSPKLK